MPAIVELTIRRFQDSSLVAELSAELPRGRANLGSTPISISVEALRGLRLLPDAYGAALTAMALPQALYPAWQRARGYAEGSEQGLHVRVALDDPTGEVHALRWELLRDPLTNTPLAQQEGGSLARLAILDDLHERALPTRPDLRALVAVAGPADSERWGLDPVDVVAEAERALAALGDIQSDVLAGDHPRSRGLATLANLLDGLRGGIQVLYLICHGRATTEGTVLYLVDETGNAAPITGEALANELRALDVAHRPLLAVLVACEGASQEQAPLASVGPLLAATGIPAVVAMQAPITIDAAASFTGRLLRELRRDGRVDRALAAARKEMGSEWWVPVLWLRVRDGRLWEGEDERTVARRQRLALARSRHSQERYAELRQGFVGRRNELKAIATEVDALRDTGGYLLVTGVAGQGKSSVLAALVEERGAETTPAYFIRFSPGSDEQVALLRHLVAELLLQHSLEELADSYLPETAGAITLANSLAMVLDRISAAGDQATLVIDGLDQIRPDRQMGERDLSFLPEKLPVGVVVVIGTRPDDTLKPLRVLASQREYRLPPLSQDDFGALLDQCGAALAAHERHALYEALHGNAFDLAFVAREITATAAGEVPALLERVRRNPQDIFAPALSRLRADQAFWRRVLRPLLGCLLAATGSEPLSEEALGAIVGLETDEVSDAILRLRGFLGETDRGGNAYYYLYHLKLIDYLKGIQAGVGERIFSARDIEQWHGKLAAWCEGGQGGIEAIWEDAQGNTLEQERRIYARQHYVAHLATAHDYERLWALIDAGEYGQAKRRYDPSTRSYVRDLDIAYQALLDEAGDNTDVLARALPRLWRYSLLRGSLTSQVDNYPEELFLALVALKHNDEALNLAELLTDLKKKADTLRALGTALLEQAQPEGIILLQRARATADNIPNNNHRSEALAALARAFAKAQRWDDARTTADAIPDDDHRSEALAALAEALAKAQRWDEARATIDIISDYSSYYQAEARAALVQALANAQRWDDARATADTIFSDRRNHARVLAALAQAFAHAQRWDDAYAAANAITDDWYRTQTLAAIAQALAHAQHWDDARAIADTITDEGDRTQALAAIAQALAHAQHWDDAQATFAAARDTATSIVYEWKRALALIALGQALVHAQRWDDARTTLTDARAVAKNIDNEETRLKILAALTQGRIAFIQALVHAQRWVDAHRVADTIPHRSFDSDERFEVLAALVQALAQAQRWDDARATASAITNKGDRVLVLAALAQTLALAQRWDDAHATFADARVIIDAIVDSDTDRDRVLTPLVRALTQAQQWDDARATANAINAISRFQDRDQAHIAIAQARTQALIQAQRWDDARAAADAVPYSHMRVSALATLAQALAKAQQWDKARATFADARATADAVPYSHMRVSALTTLAQALAQAQQWDKARATFADARTTVDSIYPERERAEALAALAQALAEAQQWGDARAVADAIPYSVVRVPVIVSLTQALAQAQQWDDARAVAETIDENDWQRTKALATLAQTLAQAQRWDDSHTTFADARTTADAIRDKWERTRALIALALAHAQAEQLEDAHIVLATARALWDDTRAAARVTWDDAMHFFEPDRAQAFTALAQAFAQIQRWDDAASAFAAARAAADDFPSEYHRANNLRSEQHRIYDLRSLAQALTQAQYWEDARATADAIPDKGYRAQALATIAQTLAQAGLLPQATALLADLWCRARTRDELLRLFAIDAAFFRAYPKLGKEFLDSFEWVDAQLTSNKSSSVTLSRSSVPLTEDDAKIDLGAPVLSPPQVTPAVLPATTPRNMLKALLSWIFTTIKRRNPPT